MAPKHFVLIHDACHGKWVWDKFERLLEKHGHSVTTVDLQPTPIENIASADQYTTPLLDFFENLPKGEMVILVGHGFGGISASIAMDKYPEKVQLAVFLNALMPDTTHRPSYVIEKHMEVFDNWEDCEFSCYTINKGAISKIRLGPNFVINHLFPQISDKDKIHAVTKISVGSFFLEPLVKREKFTDEGYGSIPKVFISSQKDTAIPTEVQNWEIQNYPVWKVYKLKGDHSPMFSEPEALCEIFCKIANSPF